jgi:hypothetical protein
MNASWQGFVSRMFAGGSTMAPLLKWPDVVPALWLAGSLVAGATLAGAARLDAKSDRSLLLLFVGAILSSPPGWVYHLPLGYGPILGWMARRDWDGLAGLSAAHWQACWSGWPAYVPHETTVAWQPSGLASLTIGSTHLGHAVPLDSAHDTEVAVTRQSMPGLERWGPSRPAWRSTGLTTLLLLVGMRQTAHTFVYAQDDPHIHLTVARTLAEHGVWGSARRVCAGLIVAAVDRAARHAVEARRACDLVASGPERGAAALPSCSWSTRPPGPPLTGAWSCWQP